MTDWKRYVLWILAVYLILLLIPLPLLGKDSEGGHTELPLVRPSTTESSESSSSSPNSSSPAKGTAVFRLLDEETGTVYEVADRDFVVGTVAAEMYPTYHAEALKAQAVASYTYYSVQRAQERADPDAALKGADFTDTLSGLPRYYSDKELKERWGENYEAYHKKVTEAVDAVFGRTITYNGELILAAYHAISSGATEDAVLVWGSSLPYLQPVASPGDKLSPSYQSTVSFTADELKSKLVSLEGCTLGDDPAGWIAADPKVSASGTVTGIVIGGVEMTGKQVRELLGLRSACFTAAYDNGRFVFNVLGYGHDVGMSQYGADYMARQGSNWEDILHYYYTGVVITEPAG